MSDLAQRIATATSWGEIRRALADDAIKPQLSYEERYPLRPLSDRFVARMRARGTSEAIIARVQRLNPLVRDGDCVRGLYQTRTCRRWLEADCCTRQEFDAKWGKGAYRRLPKSRLIRAGGRRRYVRCTDLMQGL